MDASIICRFSSQVLGFANILFSTKGFCLWPLKFPGKDAKARQARSHVGRLVKEDLETTQHVAAELTVGLTLPDAVT